MLRFIEDIWGLTQLTHRDRDATNLSYNFDFSRTPRGPMAEMPLRTTCPTPVFPGAANFTPVMPTKPTWLPDQTASDGTPPAEPPPGG